LRYKSLRLRLRDVDLNSHHGGDLGPRLWLQHVDHHLPEPRVPVDDTLFERAYRLGLELAVFLQLVAQHCHKGWAGGTASTWKCRLSLFSRNKVFERILINHLILCL
jgi:hypothetical protein